MSQINLELVRDSYSRDMGTFGKLSVLVESEKLFECETVERPWCQNEANISCVPEGVYALKPRRFYRGGYEAMEICDVPERSLILIHIANTMFDVQGCVGVGNRRGFILGHWAVLNSKVTFGELMGLLPPPDLGTITIRQHVPDMVRFGNLLTQRG